jgi:hypothetical protein
VLALRRGAFFRRFDVMSDLVIAERFRGPPNSANGGYFAGCVSRLAGRTVRVRLRSPPPLEVPLQARHEASGRVEILNGEERIAEADPVDFALEVPPPVDYVRALEASRNYAGFVRHSFPTCFVCGPKRARGDGLRVFAGPIGAGRVAAPWTPDESLGEPDGKIAPEIMWAVLDCPGYFAVSDGRPMLLAELTAHVDRRVHALEPCVIVGWSISSSGRKHEAGTALFDEDGELCARAKALWIEPRTARVTGPAG